MKVNIFKAVLSSTLLFTQSLFAFTPLAEDEMPKGTFSVPFATKTKTDPKKIRQLKNQGFTKLDDFIACVPLVEIGTDTRNIEITFLPGGEIPEFIVPTGFPFDATSHIHAMIRMEKKPTTNPLGFGYISEDVYIQPNPQHVIGECEYRMSLTPDEFISSFKDHLYQVQQDGIKAVSRINPEIVKTIDIILNGSSKQRKTINQDHFKEVFKLVSYVFGGTIKGSPLGIENSNLKADVSLEPGSKPQIRVKNSQSVKTWLETVGLGLSEDKTHLRIVPKANVK